MMGGGWYRVYATNNTTAAATGYINATGIDGWVRIVQPVKPIADTPPPRELHWCWEDVDLIHNPIAASPYPFIERRPSRRPYIIPIAHPRPPPAQRAT